MVTVEKQPLFIRHFVIWANYMHELWSVGSKVVPLVLKKIIYLRSFLKVESITLSKITFYSNYSRNDSNFDLNDCYLMLSST